MGNVYTEKMHKLEDVKQTIGFFALTIGWALMNIFNSIYIVLKDGKADDSGVIIFWSGFFILFSWMIFLIWPLNKIDHSKRMFNPYIFPFISGLYAAIIYTIMIGGIFQSIELVLMFMPQAVMTGIIFGIFYSILIKSKNLINFLYNKPVSKLILFLSPAIILGIFLWVLPMVIPSQVYRYVPDSIRHEIVRKTIPKFKVGDDFELLQHSLPGYFDHIQNGQGNMSATMENFAFVLEVNCEKIIRLEYGENPSDFDSTLNGNFRNKPCP